MLHLKVLEYFLQSMKGMMGGQWITNLFFNI